LITLSIANIVGVTSYFWELVSIPDGSSAILSDPTIASPTFLATQAAPGSYLIRVTINNGSSLGTNGLAFLTLNTTLRKLALSENLEFGLSGWAEAINDIIDAVEAGVSGSISLQGAYVGGHEITISSGQPAVTITNNDATGSSIILGGTGHKKISSAGVLELAGSDVSIQANSSLLIPFNDAIDHDLVGFSSSSIIGALNELKSRDALSGIGNPDGYVTGYLGQAYLDTVSDVIYINIDGATSWAVQ
jgi:hypothetical protein